MPLSRSRCLRSALFLLWLSAQAITAPNSLASIYTYTDNAGVQTFTNEFDSIPEKYRDQVSRREFDEPQTHVSAPTPAAVQPPVSPIQVRTVTGSGEYRMGDHDRRADAVRLAIEAAKKDALEQVATYVEGITEVTQMDVTRDDIRSFTAGIVKVSDQKITSRLEEDTIVIRADLTTEIDPHEVAQAGNVKTRSTNCRPMRSSPKPGRAGPIPRRGCIPIRSSQYRVSMACSCRRSASPRGIAICRSRSSPFGRNRAACRPSLRAIRRRLHVNRCWSPLRSLCVPISRRCSTGRACLHKWGTS